MLLIPCPWCGERSETEFCCGGEAEQPRPDPNEYSDQAWVEYLCRSNNVRGELTEIWCHERGCGEWFKLGRNTVTHALTVDPDGCAQ
jgi:heterotetrameric sarcosine oxidase delta subunit